jgi:hypothetical protein
MEPSLAQFVVGQGCLRTAQPRYQFLLGDATFLSGLLDPYASAGRDHTWIPSHFVVSSKEIPGMYNNSL